MSETSMQPKIRTQDLKSLATWIIYVHADLLILLSVIALAQLRVIMYTSSGNFASYMHMNHGRNKTLKTRFDK